MAKYIEKTYKHKSKSIKCWAFKLQRGRDSNPRYAINVYTLSKRAP